MADHEQPTIGEIHRRMNVIEHNVEQLQTVIEDRTEWRHRLDWVEQEAKEMRELVDGQEPWSHRKRLHDLEGRSAASELLADALAESRKARYGKAALIAQWGSLAIALAALIVALSLRLHGA